MLAKFLKIKNAFQINFTGRKSYSQNGEDLNILDLFPKSKKVSYLDLGANHPIKFNNTHLLYKNGSRGISVDPDVRVTFWYKIFRPFDTIIKAAVVSGDEKEIRFYFINNPVLNTTSEHEAKKAEDSGFRIIKEDTVVALNINNLLSRFENTNGPDFLNIDVEGIDEDILYAIDFKKFTPRSICIETGVFMDLSRDKKKRVDAFIFSKGYEVVFYNTNNTIYVLSSYWGGYMKSLGVKLV